MKNILIILTLALLAIACSTKQEQTKETIIQTDTTVSLTQTQYQNAGIELGGVKLKSMPVEINANGLIDVPPQNLASVSMPMGGYVRKTSVLPGMHVHAGEVLAELENLDFIKLQQEYLMAISKEQMAQTEFQRQKEMNENKVNALREYQNASTDFAIAKANTASLEQQLQILGIRIDNLKKGNIAPRILVRSPISGNVKAVTVTLGKYVNPMDAMYEIVDNSHMHLELKVFEKDILNVKEKQKIIFTVPASSTDEFSGSVYLVGKTFDNTSRTILVHGHLDKEDKEKLIPGMYVAAKIIVKNEKLAVLPEDALVKQDNAYFIFVKQKEENKRILFRKLSIEVRAIKNGVAAITASAELMHLQNIVQKGAYFINSEMNREDEE